MKTFKEISIDQVLEELQETNTNILDNPFRLGSMMYFEVIKEFRKQDTAIKNDPVVWVGNGNKSGRDKSMTFEFSYDNPSMTWAGLDKLWNDA